MKLKPEIQTGLEEIISCDKAKDMLKYILTKSINLKIKDINDLGIVYYDTMEEYNFSLNKLRLTIEQNKEIDVYIRAVDKGKVKETIFCYWNLIIQKRLIRLDTDDHKIENVFIKEIHIEQFRKEISLELRNDKIKQLEDDIKVYFIEFENYLKQNKEKMKYREYLEKFSDFNFFIATIIS